MPESSPVHVPLPRLAGAVAALAAPAAVILIGLWIADLLEPAGVVAGIALSMAAIGFLVRRHLAGLERLRLRIENLARNLPTGEIDRADFDLPATAAGLARAVAELDRNRTRYDEELRAVVAANEALFEAIPDPLILVDADRVVRRANAAARELFGEAVAGRDVAALLREPDLVDAIEEGLAGRAAIANVDLDWPGPPERHFSVRFAQAPEAQARAILLALRDVTALKQAEKMRADFVANVSHELRTPLSALLGFTETLRGPARDDAPARDRFLGIMQEQAQRMTRLVRDLLSLSRIEETEHTPPTERVEVPRVIGGVVDTLALQARAKGTTVEVDAPANLPPVSGDADQLAQVFQNLIDNAIKYGKPQGKVRVVVRATAEPPVRVTATLGRRRDTEAPGWVSVAVADDGDGIPREHLPRLTERFYRVDAARSRQLGGTGLGLAIVKHILNRHRGALAIDSEPGRGSVFAVWLPSRADSVTD